MPHSHLEDYALNMAGTLAVLVALFPMKWPSDPSDSSYSLHGTFAISFFLCIAYVCNFRAADTLSLIHDDATRKRYLRTYQTLGWAMVIFPAFAWGLISLMPFRKSVTFFVELAGIYVFAMYWVVKSGEVAKTNVNEKASRGKLRVKSHGLSDVLRPLPVIPIDEPKVGTRQAS